MTSLNYDGAPDMAEPGTSRASCEVDIDNAFFARGISEIGGPETVMLCEICCRPEVHVKGRAFFDPIVAYALLRTQQRVQGSRCKQMLYPTGLLSPLSGLQFSVTDHAKVPLNGSRFEVNSEVVDGNGIGQHPRFRLASEAQKELFLDSRRGSDNILPLTANPLNAEDCAVWKVAEGIFEDLGGIESSTA
jgi:hypothetical protein